MRAKRILLRSGIIACGVILFGMLFRGSHLLLTRRASVTGEREQNGWAFVRRFSGKPQPVAPPNAFFAFFRRAFGQPEYPASDDDLQYPALEFLAPERDGRPDGDVKRAGLTAHAVSSTGDRFALGLTGQRDVMGWTSSDAPDTYARNVYLHLPAVPATYRWLDITVADKKGHRGTWRVFDLPQLVHQTFDPTAAGPITPVPGITLAARAWWNAGGTPVTPNGWSGPENDFLPVNAEVQMQKNLAGDATHHWSLTDFKLREEWEPSRAAGRQDMSVVGESFRPYAMDTSNPNSVEGFAAPFPGVQHTVQIDSALAERKNYDETVTFHNLRISRLGAGWSLDPNPNAVAQSPSGVTVRLVRTPARASNAHALSTYRISKDMIYYRFQIDQGGLDVVLPQSPLYKRYHHPLEVSGEIDIPMSDYKGMEGWSGDNFQDVSGGFSLNTLPADHVIRTLQFTVTQNTVVRKIPVRFVVPVIAGKPKAAWQGY